MPHQGFAERVKALARERSTSVAQVGYAAHDPSVRGTNPDTFRSVMAGRRRPTLVLIEAVARVLEIDPGEFPEYRLALARRQLDEHEVGLEQAIENLDRIEAAMQTQPTRAQPRASAPAEANPQPHRAGGRAARTRKAS